MNCHELERSMGTRARCVVALACAGVLLLTFPLGSSQERVLSETVQVTALAVTQTPAGFVGVPAKVSATVIQPGTGQVYVATKPLAAADMQGSARLAAQVAASIQGLDWR